MMHRTAMAAMVGAMAAMMMSGASAAVVLHGDGRIELPIAEAVQTGDGALTWTWTASRWGMYEVAAPEGVGQMELSFGGAGVRGSADRPARIYLERAGKVTLRFLFSGDVAVGATLVLKPAAEGRPIRQAADGTVTLHARDVTIHGVKLRYEPKEEKNTIGFWTEVGDYASWWFTATRPGRYEVRVLQGCGEGQGGSEAAIEVAGQRLAFTVEETGHFQNFVERTIGTVNIERSGRQRLVVRATTKAAKAVMDLREVKLVPVAE